MKDNQFMQFKPRAVCFTASPTRSGLLGHFKLAGIYFLALFISTSVVLGSGSLQAQEVAIAAQVSSININTADAEALAAGLTGVGLSRAREIVRHREAFGPFESVDELQEVKGVGSSTIEKNRALLTLE